LARVLERSNLRVAPTTALLLSVCLAIVHGVVALLLSASVWLVIVVCISTFCASLGGFYVLMTRRISMFGRQFPVAIELMARATRAGESLENAFLVAGNTSDDPLKSEFLRCVRQMQLGQTPVRATEDLAQRIHTTDLYLLADVLSMHMEVGGKLARSLERLAEIIRERAEFHEQMRSTTGIARFAVLAVTIIGLFVFIYMQTVQPEYLAKLAESSFGRKMIAYGVLSEAVGLLWVGLTLRSDF
jgi:tight adherence protein B